MRFLLDLARRDLAGSGRSLWVFCACLALGVTLIAATGGLYRLIHVGLLADTRVLMGGDLEIESNEPLPERALDWMAERGDVSLLAELDTMLGTERDDFLRVELQSVDERYPLYGTLQLEPDLPLEDVTAFRDGRWGVAIDPVLAGTLGIGMGDSVFIGSLSMQVRALVENQPDRSLSAEWRGAPVLLSGEAVAASGLIQPGSLVDYEYRVRTDIAADAWRRAFYAAFPDEDWEVRTFEDRSRRVSERLGQIASGLLIIAFSTLFIGGLGVFNSIRSYLQEKLKTIATLRALGLRNRRLATVYLLQVGLLAGGASAAGAALGSGLAFAGAMVVASRVPMETALASTIVPGVVAVAFGLLTAFAFALPAIGRALSVAPAALFRGIGKEASRAPGTWQFTSLGCGALVVLLVLVTLPDTLFALAFVLMSGALLVLLEGIVRLVKYGALRFDDHPVLSGRFALRLAMANLHRPGTPLRASLLSLGSALTLLVVCTLVTAALVRAVNDTIPEESPALVLYDIGNHQLDQVRGVMAALPSTARVDTTPLVRSRIAAINGTPGAEYVGPERSSRRDAATEDYDLSYSGNNIDDVMLMSIEPGWSGQTLDPGVYPRIEAVRNEADRRGLPVEIEIDGGVKIDNAQR
ncbi:MAG: FtsX-like permease family protein, partial [Woeseia sp.]